MDYQKRINEWAQEASAKFGPEELDKCCRYIATKIMADSDFAMGYLEECVAGLARMAMYRQRSSMRQSVKAPAVQRTERGAGGAAIAMAARTKSIFDTWCIRDKALGDCVRSDLVQAMATERNQKLGHAKNEMFYRLLLERIEDEQQPLRKQLKAADAQELLDWATAGKEPKSGRATPMLTPIRKVPALT